jgi:hypothetical protein
MPWDRRCASSPELEVHSSTDQARPGFAWDLAGGGDDRYFLGGRYSLGSCEIASASWCNLYGWCQPVAGFRHQSPYFCSIFPRVPVASFCSH